ncbi:hypothetical protein [Comamonas sp. C24C]
MELDFTPIKVDYKTHVTEDGRSFLDLNPLGYAPSLELKDGSLPREGPAILQYLAGLSPICSWLRHMGPWSAIGFKNGSIFLTSEICKGFIRMLHAYCLIAQ